MKVVRGYHHHDGSIGVLARFEVGSDFTSRTPEFKTFADGVLMSVAAAFRDMDAADPAANEIMILGLPWIGEGGGETIGDTVDMASKQFREKITVDSVSLLGDGADRRPKHVQERAARGYK